MRYLVFDKEAMCTALAFRLSEIEGEEVRFLSQTKEGEDHLKGMVEQVKTLDQGLNWVGKNGLVICGDEQNVTRLRKMGYSTYGGNMFTQALEDDRAFQLKIAKDAGLPIPNFHAVKSPKEAIEFIKKNPDQYVLKQTGDLPKWFNFVGKEENGEDIIEQLLWFEQKPEFKQAKNGGFILQEFVEGMELSCTGWWQYDHWMKNEDGTILLSLSREHKKQGERDHGNTTGEMGTTTRFVKQTKLFDEVLNKLTPILQKKAGDVCLSIDVNCGIVEKDDDTGKPRAYLYEITAREGYPYQAIIEYGMLTSQADFFRMLIKNEPGTVQTRDAWLVGTVLGAGRFPFEFPVNVSYGTFRGQPVKFPFEIWDEHVSPNYVMYDASTGLYRIADNYEDVCTVVYHGKDIIKTNEKCVKMMEKIVVRNPQLRLDIGEKFAKEEVMKLNKMGYIEDSDMPGKEQP